MVIISFQRAPIIVRGKNYTDCADYIYSFQCGNAYRTTLEAREIALQDSRTILCPKILESGGFHFRYIFIESSVDRYSFER